MARSGRASLILILSCIIASLHRSASFLFSSPASSLADAATAATAAAAAAAASTADPLLAASPPALLLSSSSSSSSSSTCGPLTIESPSRTGVYNVSRVEINVGFPSCFGVPRDGHLRLDLDAGAPHAHTFRRFTQESTTISGLRDGRHTLNVSLVGRSGKAEFAAWTQFRVRSARPQLRVDSPVAGQVYTGASSVPVSFTVKDFNIPYDGVVRMTMEGQPTPMHVQVRQGGRGRGGEEGGEKRGERRGGENHVVYSGVGVL